MCDWKEISVARGHYVRKNLPICISYGFWGLNEGGRSYLFIFPFFFYLGGNYSFKEKNAFKKMMVIPKKDYLLLLDFDDEEDDINISEESLSEGYCIFSVGY